MPKSCTKSRKKGKSAVCGTYAHFLKNGVAFGAFRLGVDYHMHGANEYLVVDEIVRSAELFALTIVALCGEHAEPM